MRIRNVTEEQNLHLRRLMNTDSPHSKTDYFEIDEDFYFVRSYDLTNKKLPFYFSFSQKNKMPVSDEFIRGVLNSDLVHHQLIDQYNIKELISENNVTHIFPLSKKKRR